MLLVFDHIFNEKVAMRILILILLLPGALAAQGIEITTLPGAKLCKEIPPVTGTQCRELPTNTTIRVLETADFSQPWVRAQLGLEFGYVEVARINAPARPANPCTDSLYVRLKAKDLKSLTDREYQYMLERDRACTEYQRALLSAQPQGRIADAVERADRRANAWIGWAIFLSIVSGVGTYLAVK